MIKLITSVVIYNPKFSDLERLFKSYNASLQFVRNEYEMCEKLIIIDNNPSGGYKEDVVKLLELNELNYEYITSEINGGYGYGHNKAVHFNCDYHLICNPDIEFLVDTLSVALKTMSDSPDIVLLTPAVFGLSGERQYLCKRNPSLLHLFLRRFLPDFINKLLFKKYLEKYEYRDRSYESEIENVPFCTGCFMFFRADVLKNLNGFDERFFMYFEDADLTRRALQYGKTLYLPTFIVKHRWERGSHKNKKLRNIAIKSALQYSLKWACYKMCFRRNI